MKTLLTSGLVGFLGLTSPAVGQSLEISRHAIAGGGGTSSGGGLSVSGTIGQHTAGPAGGMSGGSLEVVSGFWAPGRAEPCPADFNGDGEVNTLDVLAFLSAWSSGDAAADCNADGSIDTLDVICFLGAWTAGC